MTTNKLIQTTWGTVDEQTHLDYGKRYDELNRCRRAWIITRDIQLKQQREMNDFDDGYLNHAISCIEYYNRYIEELNENHQRKIEALKAEQEELIEVLPTSFQKTRQLEATSLLEDQDHELPGRNSLPRNVDQRVREDAKRHHRYSAEL